MRSSDPTHVDDRIDRAIARYAEGLESVLTSHPEIEELIAYQEGRLEPEQEAPVREHLVGCRRCVDEVERLDALDQAESSEEVDPALDLAIERGWERFQSAVGTPEPARETPRSPWGRGLLAATILFAIAGGAAWFQALQMPGTPSEGLAPGHLFVESLWPDGQNVARGTGAPQEVDVPSGSDLLVFRLLLGTQTDEGPMVVELTRSPDGELVWRQDDLRRQPSGDFAVLIPRSRASDGEYTLLLLSQQSESGSPIATYSFRLRDGE